MNLFNNLQSRLDFEKPIMRLEMPQFRLFQFGDDCYFSGWQTTATMQRQYELKLVMPSWYPDQMPSLYVTSPLILYKYNNRKTVNDDTVSHAFHTMGNGPLGCVQICHYNNESWDASKTCVGVFTKGILWLEAYEGHLKTGRNIADILNSWKRRQ